MPEDCDLRWVGVQTTTSSTGKTTVQVLFPHRAGSIVQKHGQMLEIHRNKKLLGAKGIATRGSWPYYQEQEAIRNNKEPLN